MQVSITFGSCAAHWGGLIMKRANLADNVSLQYIWEVQAGRQLLGYCGLACGPPTPSPCSTIAIGFSGTQDLSMVPPPPSTCTHFCHSSLGDHGLVWVPPPPTPQCSNSSAWSFRDHRLAPKTPRPSFLMLQSLGLPQHVSQVLILWANASGSPSRSFHR
jgi:hypothetical protein